MGNKNLEIDWIENNLTNIQASSSVQRGFQISKPELIRLYGDMASRKELEKCVRDLERHGVLKKVSKKSAQPAPETYIFVNEVRSRLFEIDKENSEVLQRSRELSSSIEAVIELNDLWADDSGGILSKGEQVNGITMLGNFVSAYWQAKLDALRRESSLIDAKMKQIEKEISQLKVLLE
ncbi:MAG TPA: hypothetical protein VFF30_14570 [Nitrososphaerales archaeon]|nr:hypothetical protein [Nitrososphaerales archaeon]